MVRAVCKRNRFDVVSDTANISRVVTGTVLSDSGEFRRQQRSSSAGADATGTIAMAAGSGKVALVKNSTALTGTCPNNPNIVDMVGYGNTANCFQRLSARTRCEQHKCSVARREWLSGSAKQRDGLCDRSS